MLIRRLGLPFSHFLTYLCPPVTLQFQFEFFSAIIARGVYPVDYKEFNEDDISNKESKFEGLKEGLDPYITDDFDNERVREEI